MSSEAKIRVLVAAQDLFMDKGFEAVKLRDIADRLGIKQPSLYYHFPEGKEQIYVEVVNRTLNTLQNSLIQHIENSTQDIRAKLHAIGIWATEELNMSPTVMFKMDLPQLNEYNRQNISKKSYETFFLPIIHVFKKAIETKQIRQIEPSIMTGLIVSMFEGVNQSAYWQTYSKMDMWEEAIDIFLNGILR